MNADRLETLIRKHIYSLAGEIGERNVFKANALQAARDYVTQSWEHQGYQVLTQGYTVQGVYCENLEVTRPGSKYPGEIILLGAHYDSVRGSPGANDNASGVGMLLTLSELFLSVCPERTIRFVAFVNEEPPFFFTKQQGSQIYAKTARQRGDDIRVMLALETVGYYCNEPNTQRLPPLFRFFYPNRADFIALVSNFLSRKAMYKLTKAFRASTDFPLQHVATFNFIPGVAWSDHLSFWRQGYKALMVTDTAFYRYPFYHSAEDTPDKIAYAKLARVTEGLFRAIDSLQRQGV